MRDAPLAHLRWGRGERAAVLLHGVGGGREAWGDSISGTGSALAEAGYTAIAPDLPGYGDSVSIDPYDMASLAASVVALIGALQPKRCVLVGHSMGGMVALELMVLAARAGAGARAQRHVVRRSASPTAPGRPSSWPSAWRRSTPAPAWPRWRPVWRSAWPRRRHRTMPWRVPAVLMSAVPRGHLPQRAAAIVGFNRRELLGKLRLPVLCLAGEDDRNAPPAVMQQMAARIAGAEFHCMAGVGHLANMEAPALFNRALIDFLRRRF